MLVQSITHCPSFHWMIILGMYIVKGRRVIKVSMNMKYDPNRSHESSKVYVKERDEVGEEPLGQ
jgi:hypothetical protein